ncbi:MAG: hypothetical protein C0520_10785 [Sphingopyxis sp.]|nr:hypothetical protein [Sphingopyxis sp.]
MAKFDMGAAWDDSLALLKSHSALTGTIAAVFLFLPALAVAWFGPAPIEPAAGADLQQVIATFRENVWQMLPYQLVVALFALVGTVAILRLWLARAATSVGEALTFAAMLLPTMIGVQIVTGVMMGIGLVLLVIPFLYLVGRLALVSPVAADRGLYNPFEIIGTSWRLTKNNGWAIFFFLFLVMVVVFIAMMIVGAIIGILASTDAGVGKMLGGVVEAGFGALGGLISIAISAAAYRQLALTGSSDIFN